MAITTSVLNSLPSNQREAFTKRCKANEDLFNVYSAILERKLRDHQSSSKHTDNYKKAAWPYFQADSVGYQRALEEVINLIQFKE
jgi:hypothetical protein